MQGLVKILNATSGIGTTLSVEDLKAQIDNLFNEARGAIDGVGPMEDINAIANTVSANNGSRIYPWLGSLPGVKEWLTTKQYNQLKEYNYVVHNKEWYNGITLLKKELRRNGLLDVPMLLEGLLQLHQDHKKEMLIDALINGTTATAYDNIAFFSNVSAPRVNDNLLAGTGTTLALLEADIVSTRLAMMSFVNDNGELMRIIPDTIVCPVSLEANFRKIQESTTDPSQANSGVANIAGSYITRVIADPALDADDANDWYYLATKANLKPLVQQNEAMNDGDEFETVIDDTKWASDGAIGYSVESASNVGYGLPSLAAKVVNT